MTLLVDTCIIIDALANRAPFAADAQELLLRGGEKRASLFVSAKSILDIHYVLKHYLHDESVVRTALSNLTHSVSVVGTSAPSIIAALGSPTSDYEDAVQIETGLIEGADYIITRDASGYTKSPIPAKNAAEIIQIMDQSPSGLSQPEL